MEPKGCACGSTTEAEPDEALMSLPDAGARD